MDVKEFISETIVQIQEGVQDAINRRTATANASGVINPVWGFASEISRRDLQNVEFDIAITATDSISGAGKGSVKVFAVASADGSVSRTSENSKVSRVKFTIPIIPPVQLVQQ